MLLVGRTQFREWMFFFPGMLCRERLILNFSIVISHPVWTSDECIQKSFREESWQVLSHENEDTKEVQCPSSFSRGRIHFTRAAWGKRPLGEGRMLCPFQCKKFIIICAKQHLWINTMWLYIPLAISCCSCSSCRLEGRVSLWPEATWWHAH